MRSPIRFLARSLWRIALLCGILAGPAHAQRSTFEILKGGDVVGSVAASRSVSGDRTLYVMTSYAEMDLLWKQTVSTAMTTEYAGNELHGCMTSIRVNGAMRDSSHMLREGDRMRCHVLPKAPFQRSEVLPWTTARMYFEEPVDQESIFVESVLTSCALRLLSPGNYLLTFPNGSKSRYVYAAGQLREIHVDRTFINLLFRRKEG